MRRISESFLPEWVEPALGDALLRERFPGRILVGVDEAGRGPLAGPVVAAAVVLDGDIEGLRDSKTLTAVRREQLYEQICARAQCFAIAEASAEEIDALNILQANFLAMRRALRSIGILNHGDQNEGRAVLSRGTIPAESGPLILVDGNLRIAGVEPSAQLPLVKGDARSASIAAASILAKVYRDRCMEQLERLFPGYGFAVNKGYPTAEHLEAIRKRGYVAAHRKSFKPKALQNQQVSLDLH